MAEQVPLKFYKQSGTYQLMPETNNTNVGTLVTDPNELKTAISWYSNPANFPNAGRQEWEGLQSRLRDYQAGQSEFLINEQGNLATQKEVAAQQAQQQALASGQAINVGTPSAPLTVPPGSAGAVNLQGGTFQQQLKTPTAQMPGVVPVDPAAAGKPAYQEIPKAAQYPSEATNFSQRFQEGHQNATNANITPSSNYEGAVDMFKTFLPGQGTSNTVNNFISQDPYLNSTVSAFQQYMSSQNQRTSLVDTYKSMLQSSGIQGIDTDLINMKKVIEGTEDDIRTEVTKAGGFATDSQVMALSNARNKQLIKNYNTLLETRNAKESYLNTMMNLTAKDREAADKSFETMTNFGLKMSELNQQMQKNAVDTLDRTAKTLGWDGVYQATQGNPQLVAQIEKAYGLPPGSLAIAAQRDSEIRKLDTQSKQAQIAAQGKPNIFGTQEGGYYEQFYDSATNSWKTRKVVGGTDGGNIVTTPGNPELQGILTTILGSGKFTKEQKKAITNAINNGEDPFTVIKNQAKNIMGQTEGTSVTKYETARNAMLDLQAVLKEFYKLGGSTDIFKGSYEKVINKLGEVNNPELVELATQIQANLQVYRNAVSGTAYSEQEGKDIASIFPGINKTEGLNTAIINGRLKAFDSTIDGTYRAVLGSGYDALKTKYQPNVQVTTKDTVNPQNQQTLDQLYQQSQIQTQPAGGGITDWLKGAWNIFTTSWGPKFK